MRRRTLGALLAAALAVLAWGVLVEPARLEITRLELTVPQWPADAAPLTVAFLTDLHVGSPHNGLDRVDRLVARVAAEAPDLVLLGGDYPEGVIGGRHVPPEDVAARLGRLRPRLGVISVLGNHDWWFDGPRVRRALEANGIRVLEDKAVEVGPLWVAGLSDGSTRLVDGTRALAPVPAGAPVLGLMHEPMNLSDWPRPPLLVLAGHSHGGQISLPLIGPLVTPTGVARHQIHGMVEEDGRRMYVSAGIGTSILPLRLGAPPELVFLTLRPPAR